MEPEPNKLPPSTADDGSLRKGGGGRALEDSDEEDYAFDPVMEEDRDGRGNEAEAADGYDEDEDADDGLSSLYEDEEVEDNEATLDEEERLLGEGMEQGDGANNYSDELKDLQDDAELSVEELRRKYYGGGQEAEQHEEDDVELSEVSAETQQKAHKNVVATVSSAHQPQPESSGEKEEEKGKNANAATNNGNGKVHYTRRRQQQLQQNQKDAPPFAARGLIFSAIDATVDKYFSRYAPAGCSSAAFKDGGGQKGVQNNEFQGFGLDFDDEEEEDGDYAPPEFWKKSIRVGPEFQVEDLPSPSCAQVEEATIENERDTMLWQMPKSPGGGLKLPLETTENAAEEEEEEARVVAYLGECAKLRLAEKRRQQDVAAENGNGSRSSSEKQRKVSTTNITNSNNTAGGCDNGNAGGRKETSPSKLASASSSLSTTTTSTTTTPVPSSSTATAAATTRSTSSAATADASSSTGTNLSEATDGKQQTPDNEWALFVLLEARYDGAEAKRRLLLAESGTEEKKGGANALGPGPGGRPVRPWTVEECALFEDGLAQFGGKHFGLIRQHKLPARSVGDLVQFYYCWKKTERHDAWVDRQRALAAAARGELEAAAATGGGGQQQSAARTSTFDSADCTDFMGRLVADVEHQQVQQQQQASPHLLQQQQHKASAAPAAASSSSSSSKAASSSWPAAAVPSTSSSSSSSKASSAAVEEQQPCCSTSTSPSSSSSSLSPAARRWLATAKAALANRRRWN